MLDLVQKSDVPSAAEKVSISKLELILSKFPRCDFDDSITLFLYGPNRFFGEHRISHSWQVTYEPGLLSISTGGHFYQASTGGDSFTCMSWSISDEMAGDYDDYSAHHRIVDDIKPYDVEVAEMDLSETGWKIEVCDEENEWLDDEEEEEEEDTFGPVVIPTPESPAERKLIALIDIDRAIDEATQITEPSDSCDFCRTPSSRLNHLVDGANTGAGWAWMCPDCWEQHGLGLGIGKGQLFTKQPDENWIWTAGFPEYQPEND